MKINGDKVKKRVEELDLSLAEVSRRAGLRVESLSEYCRGLNHCPRNKIEDIADVLDLDWLEIVEVGGFY